MRCQGPEFERGMLGVCISRREEDSGSDCLPELGSRK